MSTPHRNTDRPSTTHRRPPGDRTLGRSEPLDADDAQEQSDWDWEEEAEWEAVEAMRRPEGWIHDRILSPIRDPLADFPEQTGSYFG